MRYGLLAALLYLAGCAATRPQEPVIVTQVVEVPVETKCLVSYPPEPSGTLADLPPQATGYDHLKAIVADLESQRFYSKALRVLLGKCATAAP